MHLIDLSTRHLSTETDRLVTTAERLDDAVVAGDSLCPGWTRGHVLTHLARNADALVRVCSAILTGEPDTMYDSNEARDAEIEKGASRSAAELAEDLRTSAARLAPDIAKVGVEHVGTTVERVPGGQLIAAERVPFMRLREVVWHHVDLDAGYTFADAPDELVRLFLEDAVARLAAAAGAPGLRLRTAEGDEWVVGDGTTRVAGSRGAVLTWLARGIDEGLEHEDPLPALPFGG